MVVSPEGNEPNILSVDAMKIFKPPLKVRIAFDIVENVAIGRLRKASKAPPSFKLTQFEFLCWEWCNFMGYRSAIYHS